MAEARLVQEGLATLDYQADAARSAGEIIRSGDGSVGFVKTDLASGAHGALHVPGLSPVVVADSASATTFSAGDDVYWDVSANLAIPAASAAVEDLYLGVATEAKVSGDTKVCVRLLPVRRQLQQAWLSRAVEFDCETGVESTAKDLLAAADNPTGCLLLDNYGIVTEQFAGSSQDQGIVTLKDTESSPNTLATITVADGGAAVNTIAPGTNTVRRGTAGGAVKYVAAGKGITGQVTQATSGGTPAGKVKVRVEVLPL